MLITPWVINVKQNLTHFARNLQRNPTPCRPLKLTIIIRYILPNLVVYSQFAAYKTSVSWVFAWSSPSYWHNSFVFGAFRSVLWSSFFWPWSSFLHFSFALLSFLNFLILYFYRFFLIGVEVETCGLFRLQVFSVRRSWIIHLFQRSKFSYDQKFGNYCLFDYDENLKHRDTKTKPSFN